MAEFRYKAYDAQNLVVEGMISADDVDAAVDELYGSGLTPFETNQAINAAAGQPDRAKSLTKSFWRQELFISDRFSLKELAAFTGELASLVKSGLPLDEAFRVIAGPGAVHKTVRLANGLFKDVLAGAQLSEAMARRPDVFAPDYRAILRAGEAGGAIGKMLGEVAELLSRRVEIRTKVFAALVYPAILISMSLASVAVILSVLIPSIAPIFSDAGLQLPGVLSLFAELQENWIEILVIMGVVAMICVIGWNIAKSNPSLRLAVDQIMVWLPVIGQFIKTREAARFARTLGTLLYARVPLMSAMRTAQELLANRHLSMLYASASKRVSEGSVFHRAFGEIELIPAAALRLVAVGEETGQLGLMLVQGASLLENDMQRRIERLVGLLTPVLTVLIGGGVGGLIMAVMSAVLSINDLAFQ